MRCKICKCKENGSWEYTVIEFADRFEANRWVYYHKEELQTFAVHESGNIFGYAVELSEQDKPVAILYPHKFADLIWIDMNN